MSRTATATPPPTYFPQRNATPTMRHCSAPNVTAVHFASRHPHQPHQPRKKSRNVSSAAGAVVGALSPRKRTVEIGAVTPTEDALGMSFEDISPMEAAVITAEGTARTQSPVSQQGKSTDKTGQDEDGDQIMGRVTPTPSMATSYSESFISTTLPTPSSSRAPSLLQPEIAIDAEAAATSGVPIVAPSPLAAKPSWVPYFGKMAKAVVNTGFIPFADKKKKDAQFALSAPASPPSAPSPSPASPSHKDDAVFVPTGPTPRPTSEELSQLSEEAALERRREWAMEQHRRVTECARLCSQWPQSGYNQSKWGPNGSRNFYEPQSYANPQYVASLMTRQADLERQMHQQSALYYTCRNYRASSEGSSMMDSEASLDSYESAQTSPTSPAASLSLSADLSAAMASPLISADQDQSASQVSLSSASPASRSPEKGAQSLTELDTFSKVSLDSSVELDPYVPVSRSFTRSQPAVRPARAQSCGAKRPLTTEAYEEEKRRRVDEAAVVSEAVDSGVIIPPTTLKPPVIGSKQLSASVPDLSAVKVSTSGAVFGHMVKTSDTHPIIISPFFPTELIPTIARSVILPPQDIESASASGFMLGSRIDVPSLLLSFAPPARPNGNVVVPSLAHMSGSASSDAQGEVKLGNLLLSSCPGKRLRMEGPVKGRGPVCRDLATDLRRIKSEGVGCLVCCLDDPELALLGVPWETYHQVALEIGLDVIRLPMPDGFTPVSLTLFDEQVSMIVRDYSLKGINVLVHCRGGVGRAGLTASAWAIKMGFVPPHPSLVVVEEAAHRQAQAQAHARGRDRGKTQPVKVEIPAELEHQIVMSIVERVIAMIRSRRGLKAIESFEQVQFLASYVRWIRATNRERGVV